MNGQPTHTKIRLPFDASEGVCIAALRLATGLCTLVRGRRDGARSHRWSGLADQSSPAADVRSVVDKIAQQVGRRGQHGPCALHPAGRVRRLQAKYAGERLCLWKATGVVVRSFVPGSKPARLLRVNGVEGPQPCSTVQALCPATCRRRARFYAATARPLGLPSSKPRTMASRSAASTDMSELQCCKRQSAAARTHLRCTRNPAKPWSLLRRPMITPCAPSTGRRSGSSAAARSAIRARSPRRGQYCYYAARVEDPDGNCIECGWRH